MRILMLLPRLSIGGMERVAVTIANGLAGRGHKVTVATFDRGDNPLAEDLAPDVRFLRKGLKPHPIMGRIPWVRHRFYDDGMWETRTSPRNLHKYYTAEGPYDLEIGFFRGLAIKAISGGASHTGFTGPRRLAWVHNDFTKAWGYTSTFRGIEDARRAYAAFDTVVCVSDEARKGFIETIGDTGNLVTIHNPLPVDEIIALGTQQPTHIPQIDSDSSLNAIIVGRLDDCAKGHLRLIDAVSSLHAEGIDIRLTIVGDGHDRDKISKHIRDNRADGYITMTGASRNPYPHIRQADLLVCASHYEGYNLTVAEALILGTPVLSTRCTGPVEILDNGRYGMIVDNSTEGLIDGLRRLATEPSLLAHYRSMATQRCDFFDPSRALEAIEELCKDKL